MPAIDKEIRDYPDTIEPLEPGEIKVPLPPAEPEIKLSLVSKLCEAGAAVGWIKKGGRNEFHKYNYATEADIVAQLRGELFKRKVFIFPHIVKNERVEIDVVTEKWSDVEKRKVPNIRKTALTNVDIEWTFVDGESGEKWTVMVPGVGEDSVDKGLYKAFTGSEKYLLMKSFLLPTGDDPERDSAEDAEEARKDGKEVAKAVAERKIAEMKAKVEEQKKAPQKAPVSVSSLFYTLPERHNGNYAEFHNLTDYVKSHPDQADALRLLFTRFMSKQFARTGAATGIVLVPTEKVKELSAVLADDMAIDVKETHA